MEDDFARRYRAVASRDGRFDGHFVTAVRTTGVYCRPSCPAQTPRPENVDFYTSAAAAVAAGFRACKRCRPDAAPGSPAWNRRADLAGRALAAIAAGALDEDGVPALARTLAVTERHLHRVLVAEVGAGPLALARARRAQTARLLLEATDLPITAVAFSAGFSSVRQFNDTLRRQFALSPSALRRQRRSGPPAEGRLVLRLGVRPPFDAGALFAYLAARAIPGLETASAGGLRRVLPGGAIATLGAGAGALRLELALANGELAAVGAAVARCRRLGDLDADPVAVDGVLGVDPVLGASVRRHPGLRVPGTVDGFELAVRAVVGQHVSVATARTLLGRLVSRHGTPVVDPSGELRAAFPSSAALAVADLEAIGLTRARAQALRQLAAQHAAGALHLEPGAGRPDTLGALLRLPGIGAWTAQYVAMRALADPDAFPAGDLVLRRAVARHGAEPERWRPWRAYGAMHLWQAAADERAVRAPASGVPAAPVPPLPERPACH